MKKMMVVLSIVVLALVAAVAFAAPHHGPAEITIDKAAAKKSAVVFPHEKHQKMVESCDTCHHTNKGVTADTASDVKACSSLPPGSREGRDPEHARDEHEEEPLPHALHRLSQGEGEGSDEVRRLSQVGR